MLYKLTMQNLEGLVGRWQHVRPVASRDLPSRHAMQAKLNRMRKQRDEWSPATGNSNKPWISGWRVGPDEEIRYRIEELCRELEVGFTIQEKEDAEFTLFCYSDASDIALGRTTALHVQPAWAVINLERRYCIYTHKGISLCNVI